LISEIELEDFLWIRNVGGILPIIKSIPRLRSCQK